MTNKEKAHKMNVAYNAINAVRENTDETKWAYKYLEDAIYALENWFEEDRFEDEDI